MSRKTRRGRRQIAGAAGSRAQGLGGLGRRQVAAAQGFGGLGSRRLVLLALIGLAFVGLLGGAALLLTSASARPTETRQVAARATPGAASGAAGAEQSFPILPSGHVPAGTRVTTYNSNPPTSGPHWPTPAAWGIYSDPLPDEQLVHNLEHGGIWVSYGDVDAATRAKLEAYARTYPEAIVLTPRPQNESWIVLASWGRLQKFDAFDEQRMTAFLSANLNKSPEKLARLEQPSLRAGQLFPEFAVTDVEGRRITRDALRGKAAIIWFTTTYCVPCQIGARVVAKLDDELGGNAFTVLVLFVDPRETAEELRSWRSQFAREDWLVALDIQIARGVELRYLDTKYLLDSEGVIRNVDVAIADERYLRLVRSVVQPSR